MPQRLPNAAIFTTAELRHIAAEIAMVRDWLRRENIRGRNESVIRKLNARLIEVESISSMMESIRKLNWQNGTAATLGKVAELQMGRDSLDEYMSEFVQAVVEYQMNYNPRFMLGAAKPPAPKKIVVPSPYVPELVDGLECWLGAIWATYDAAQDVFKGGNFFVPRANTVYRDHRVVRPVSFSEFVGL